MEKPKGFGRTKHRYDVFVVGTGHGCYVRDYCREYAGSATADSPAQACNIVRFNMRSDKYPNGGYATWILGDRLDEGYVDFKFVAQLSN